MAGCLIPLSSATSNVVGLHPLSVDCCISSPLRLIATSLLCRNPSRCLSTPSPSSVAVTPPGRRYCVIRGWHFESCLLRFSTRPILPLVDCSVLPSALCLAFTFRPTVSPTQLLPVLKTNAICVGQVSVPPPPISSIPTLSVACCRRRSLPSRCPSHAICLIVGSCCCRRHRPTLSASIRRWIESVIGGRPLADARRRVDVVGLVRNFVVKIVASLNNSRRPSAFPQPSPPTSRRLPPPSPSSPSSSSSPLAPSTPSSPSLPSSLPLSPSRCRCRCHPGPCRRCRRHHRR
jgi:hypothetical protein